MKNGDDRLVIVGEDDPVMARLLELQLTRGGFRVRLAFDGHTVLDRVREEVPAMLVLDYRLPGRTGLEILRSLRAEEAYGSVPVFFVTGHGSEHLRQSLYDAGAREVFTKPFSPSLLVDRVLATVAPEAPGEGG